jgi:hypothetical protein
MYEVAIRLKMKFKKYHMNYAIGLIFACADKDFVKQNNTVIGDNFFWS